MSEEQKAAAFIPKKFQIGSIELRPFTARSLVLMQLVGNPLLKGGEVPDILFHIASFVFIHTADPSEIQPFIDQPIQYREAVLEFTSKLSVPELIGAADKIREIIERGMIGQDFSVDSEGHDPN